MDPVPPSSIGKYEIISVIGRGGMGVVYRAQDPLMGRHVAIKTVTDDLSHHVGMLQRFYGEAEKMGMLRHPNIITVYDLGEHNGFPYIVMEFVEGDPLDRLIVTGESISLFDKLRIIEQVCAALAYAHQHDVIHRDVKPANVIVRPDGVAKLLDFGIARQEKASADRSLTQTGSIVGTIPYMAPERLKGMPFDGRSDIFAAGILLFQILTGRLPFTGQEYVLVNQLLNEKHPPLSEFLESYPPGLDAILDRALAKDPADRYQLADEMAADLYAITETLKEEYSQELFALARQLSADEDYIGAQNALVRLLKMDAKNLQARAMMKEASMRLSSKERAGQAEKLNREASEAMRDKNYEQAVRLLEEASKLAPDHTAIMERLGEARTKKQTNDQIVSYLQRVEVAKRSGDFAAARAIIERALQLDTDNSRLRAAYDSLVRQAESHAQQSKLKGLIEKAKDALESKDFREVLDVVKQAEVIDPTNLEIPEIAAAAREGMYQEQRRRLLEDLAERIAHIATEQDAQSVARILREHLEKSPSDATLLRYMAQIDRMLHDYEVKREVDEIVRQCRTTMETAPQEALETVRKALERVPGDKRLLALEARIHDHIGRLSAQEARASILREANDALKQRKFDMAVAILEQCPPAILTPEISELLDFARSEARQAEQEALIARSYLEAQTLLREHRYAECVNLLSPVVQSSNDSGLRAALGQAQSALDKLTAERAAHMSLVQPYIDTGCHDQVIAFIESLPDHSAEFEELRRASDEARRQERQELEVLGRAYAALSTGDWELVANELKGSENSALLTAMRQTFLGRRMNAVDTILTGQVKQFKEAKAAAIPIDAAVPLDQGRKLLPLASDAVKAEWTALAENSPDRKNKLFGRFGKRH